MRNFSNNKLMILYLSSKSMIEKNTEFDLDSKENYQQIINQAMLSHRKNKPEIFNYLSALSEELKSRNFTSFRGWYDFSNWENFHHFVIKVYENKSAPASFSLN